MDIQTGLNQIIAEIVEQTNVLNNPTGKSLIDDLQLDSVALMELAAEIEERFGIHPCGSSISAGAVR